MEIKGKIIAVLPLQTGEGRNGQWKSQDYVLEYNIDSQYPKKMVFNIFGDKIDQFKVAEGQMVKVDFDIEGREYNGRWFNNVRAWRVEASADAPADNYSASQQMTPPPFSPADIPVENETSDLPF
jgi:hypothetical protein